MRTTFPRQTLGSLAGAILVAVTISLPGCATMQGNTDSESSFVPDWGNALRVPPANSEISGLSDTSRQIERNLGFE